MKETRVDIFYCCLFVLFAALQRHLIYGSLGAVIGLYLEKWRVNRQGEKDFMYYHYMILHPQDFPPPGSPFLT